MFIPKEKYGNTKFTKQNSQSDNAGVKLPPPLLYLAFGLMGIGINALFPLPIGIMPPLTYSGIALILGSVVLVRYIRHIFIREGTNVIPWKTTSKIITYGPFRYSRNPIYVAACGVLLGLGILFNTYWAVLTIIPALITVYYTAIKKEEEYLEKKFGEKYLAYKAWVRRWL